MIQPNPNCKPVATLTTSSLRMLCVFWALLLYEANTILIIFWTELGEAENFLIAPRTTRINFANI